MRIITVVLGVWMAAIYFTAVASVTVIIDQKIQYEETSWQYQK